MTESRTDGRARRRVLTGLGATALAAVLPVAGARASAGTVVVELFTSQGCSSCPPAERLLAELTERPNFITLGYHVQYWDHIGWKDPYGDPRCQERQEAYRAWLGTRFLYTPQMVIGGRYDVVGSRRGEVEALIASDAKEPQLSLELTESQVGEALRLPKGSAGPKGAQLLAVRYLDRATTEVARGENAGRTLSERNIVRDLERLTVWGGEQRLVPLPAGRDVTHGQALLLQDLETGAILAALDRPPLG
ncbi:MAG: DUF1223 domain-containing protein [Rhodospirillales bacterium]